MKKLVYTLFLVILLGTLTHSKAVAVGRLNFMLINLTGLDIIDVRICPTYYPNYISENLLKTNLETNTRIYIGPNYYGDQKYWNIQLTWSNGYTHMFTHNLLTRYNTYMAYASPYGVKMRQSYERTFARYDFTPGIPMHSTQDNAIAVGTPEKVNVAVADANKLMANANTANITQSSRRTRDLVFEEDKETAPTVVGSTADKVQGKTIAMKTTVEMSRNGKTTTVLPTEEFKSGDKVRLIFSTNCDGHIYWLTKGTSGQYQVLYPNKKVGMNNSIIRNKEYTIPTNGAWRFDDKKGTETLVCILSQNPVADLEKAVQLSNNGNRQAASSIIEGIINSHETKRTTRDLVFEEEDEQDVNTKSQKSEEGEPFVAIYELTHN